MGYEIKLSYSHPEEDICDKLKGKYPKSFVWTGWHPNDLCYEVPILKSEEEFYSLDGKAGANEVTDVPQGFKDWVKENTERIEAAGERGTEPYFIRDNKGVVDGILKPKVPKRTASEDNIVGGGITPKLDKSGFKALQKLTRQNAHGCSKEKSPYLCSSREHLLLGVLVVFLLSKLRNAMGGA